MDMVTMVAKAPLPVALGVVCKLVMRMCFQMLSTPRTTNQLDPERMEYAAWLAVRPNCLIVPSKPPSDFCMKMCESVRYIWDLVCV